MKRIIFFAVAAVTVILFGSCGNSSPSQSAKEETSANDVQIPAETLNEINGSLEQIDKILETTSHATQEDINQATNIMGAQQTNPDEMKTFSDKADSIWKTFRNLCREGEYRKAWELYYEKKDNDQYFIKALRTTICYYEFYMYVLASLDKVYDSEHAVAKKTEHLDLVLLLTKITFATGNGYIPPYYETLFYDCLTLHKLKGDDEGIQEIIEEYGPDMCIIKDISEKELEQKIDELLSNFKQ